MTTKQLYSVICLLWIATVPVTGCATTGNPPKPIEIRVVDDDGNPVERATVLYIFDGVTVTDNVHKKGKTGNDGVITRTGPSYFGAYIQIMKEGYYKSTIDRVRDDRDAPKWSREVVLRAIKNPIPMYAKRFSGKVPKANEYLGFDFRVGDWVSPVGQGKTTDIELRVRRDINPEGHVVTMDVRVPEGEGGLLSSKIDPNWRESTFMSPYLAPSTGYRSSYQLIRTDGREGWERTDESNLFIVFKTRGVSDGGGNSVDAHYTKGMDFQLYAGTGEGVTHSGFSLTYYFNPSRNDRNLEFDVDRNLFDRLESDEEVEKP